MNKQQVEAHGEVIKWFVDNPDKGVWGKFKEDWTLHTAPHFCIQDKYVQNDKHVEARKWKVDGRQLQRRTLWGDNCSFNKEWEDYDKSNPIYLHHNGTEVEYRIKPEESAFKIGDWVITTLNEIIQVNRVCSSTELFLGNSKRYIHVDGSCGTTINDIKLWKPTEGEWCVFWNLGNSYIIRPYLNSHDDYHYENVSVTGWRHIAPLEFIKTLKDVI